MEHDGETINEETERPSLETIKFALAITTAFDHRPPGVSEVPVDPLLANIAINAAESDIRRLAYRRSGVVMISAGGPVHTGEQRDLRLE